MAKNEPFDYYSKVLPDCYIYISHLDLQQLLQRAFRRADIDLVHSQGFNPHPKISYGNALALGTESQGEYVDVEIVKDLSIEEYLKRMNEQLPEGIKFIEAKEIDKQEASLASVIEYGEYIFTIETETNLIRSFSYSELISLLFKRVFGVIYKLPDAAIGHPLERYFTFPADKIGYKSNRDSIGCPRSEIIAEFTFSLLRIATKELVGLIVSALMKIIRI